MECVDYIGVQVDQAYQTEHTYVCMYIYIYIMAYVCQQYIDG